MSAAGWAVTGDDGLVNVRSVSPTRRGALVNWLCTEKGLMATQKASDEDIERMWEANRGHSIVIPVSITPT